MSTAIIVTSDQIATLAERLNSLEETFTAEERSILLATFSLASEAIARRVEGKTAEVAGYVQSSARVGLEMDLQGRMPSLGQGFQDSFTPGPAGSVGSEGYYKYTLTDVLVSG